MRTLWLCLAIYGLAPTPASSATAAQTTPASATDCVVQAASENVTVLVCPPGLSREDWRAAGEEVCDSASGICNVWIWDDAAKAPRDAPPTDAELSPGHVRDAVAVWVDDAKRLMTLRRAGD